MGSILSILAPAAALVAIASGAVVGADVADIWAGPTFIKDAAYFVVGLAIVAGVIVGGFTALRR